MHPHLELYYYYAYVIPAVGETRFSFHVYIDTDVAVPGELQNEGVVPCGSDVEVCLHTMKELLVVSSLDTSVVVLMVPEPFLKTGAI